MTERPTPAAKGVIIRDNRLLLIKENLTEGKGWTLPGGRLCAIESPEEALKREVLEETGLSVSITNLIDYYSFSSNVETYTVAMVFLCSTESYNINIDNNTANEIIDYNWFTPKETTQLSLARGLQPVIDRLDLKKGNVSKIKCNKKMQYDYLSKGKMVRDKIPEIIIESGRIPVTSRTNGKEYYYRLQEKLVEEVQEYLESGNNEELADIIEVVCALSTHSGEDFDKILSIQKQKKEERGGFKQGIVLTDILD